MYLEKQCSVPMGLHSGTTVDRRPMSKLKITEKGWVKEKQKNQMRKWEKY